YKKFYSRAHRSGIIAVNRGPARPVRRRGPDSETRGKALRSEGTSDMAASLPIVGSEGNLTRYLQEIRRFPMLAPEEEFMLAKRWREHEDTEAAHKLVTSHLRLVAK